MQTIYNLTLFLFGTPRSSFRLIATTISLGILHITHKKLNK